MERYFKSKKTFSLLLIVIFYGLSQLTKAQHDHYHNVVKSADIPLDRVKNDCRFFLGDTLNGFAMEATIEEGINKKFDIYSELKWYVYSKQKEFVKTKYKIKQLPREIAAAAANDNKRIIIHPRVANAACNNVDFEAGTFANWTGTTGYNTNSNTALTTSTGVITTLGVNSPETSCSFHTLMTAAGGADPWGGFPVVDPGGGVYAVRLGGENINTNDEAQTAGCIVNYPSGVPDYYSNGETLETTFLVTPNNTLLTYNYAVVLAKAPHPNGQQPYFRVEVLDHTGAEIPCLNYYVQGDSAGTYPPGFIDVGGAEALPWQQSSLNLLPYLTQNITVRFTAAGCIPGGHFGYGYVDCACAPLEIIIPTFACQGGIDSLIAPPVAGSTYAWTGPGIVSGATSQVITANAGGTYSVTITNALGCSYTLDTTIVFHPKPSVTVTGNPPCAGGNATLTAASTGSAGALTYTWSPAAGLTFSSGDSIAVATPVGNTTYSVTGTSVNGCTNTAAISINPNPTTAATFTAPTVCIGSATPFTNTTAGASTYSWTFGDGGTSTLQNPSNTYATAGNFPVSLTVTTAAGCISSGTQTVYVISNPTASFSAPQVCLGNATAFTSTITNGNTYSWTFGDGQINTTSATPSNLYATSGTFAVSLTVTAAGGCTINATNSVVVNPLPTASFTVGPVCQGTGSAFNNTSTLDNICAWNFGAAGNPAAALTSCAAINTFTYTASGTFPVTLTVTSAAGCTTTATGNAVVNTFPVLGFTANHPCDGTGVSFVNTTANQATITNWDWNFGDGSADATIATPPAHIYPAANCYPVILTATATTGCSGTFSATVNVHPNPVADFNALEACLGTPSDFMDVSTVTNPACLNDQITSWQWSFGDGQTSTNTVFTDTVKHTYAACGPYNITLTVTTNNNCTNTVTLTGDTVFCLPVVTAPPNFSVCPGAATPVQTFTTTCTNGGTPTAIWFQSLSNIDNTGAPTNFINPGGNDQVPSYNAIAQNMSCNLLRDSVYGVAVSGVGCVGNAVYYTANVFPTPYLNHMKTDSICANQTITIPSFTACPANSVVTWTNSNTGIGLAANGTGNIGSFNGTNATNTLNTALINAIPTANGCIGNDSSFTIVIKPLPTITATGSTVCPGNNVPAPTITTNPAGGVGYIWTVSNNINIGMPASGSGSPIAYTAPSNNTLTNQIGIVTYTPSLNGCKGPSANDTINIKPTPFVSHVPSTAYCPNQLTAPINFVCIPAGGTPVFTWQGLGGIGGSSTGNIAPFVTVNNTNASVVATVSVNATLNGCPGPDSTFKITVFPNPVASFIATPACDGSPMNFTSTSSVGGGFSISTWDWDMNNDGNYNDVPPGTTPNPQYTISPVGIDSVGLLVYSSSVPSCTAITKEAVIVHPNPVVNFIGVNLKGCPTLNTAFTSLSTISSDSIVAWNWSFPGNIGQPPIYSGQYPPSQNYNDPNSPSQPAYYDVSLKVTSNFGCTSTKLVKKYIEVYPTPIAAFSWGPQDADIDNPLITFVNQAQYYAPYMGIYGPYGIQYDLGHQGAPNDSLVHTPHTFTHAYNDIDLADIEETYNVTQWVVNSYGCTDSVMHPVYIKPIFTFYIPNAFTPNGDQKNEGFKGIGEGIDNTTYNMWIFDRWGMMIYHAMDINTPWDGHMRGDEGRPVLQEDVYVWKVKFNDIFGTQHEYHGTVTLIK